MVNVKDVAEHAKVSTATVSRVLSNKHKVKEKTREKVLKAMKELEYYPNNLGRQLRKMKTMSILVLVPNITNSFFSGILNSIERIAIENGYEVLLSDTKNKLADKYFEFLYEKKVDGIISLTNNFNIELLKKVRNEFPIVFACEKVDDINIPSITIDNVLGAREMTKCLIEHGHNKISHVSGPLSGILGSLRANGFQKEMQINNLEINRDWIFEGDFTLESGYKIGKKILELENKPTAIFASNDEMAIGIIKVLQSNGLQIPNDISIVGFDNIMISNIINPGLTTYAQPVEKIGKLAITKLLKIIDGKSLDQNETLLEGNLLERSSVKFNR